MHFLSLLEAKRDGAELSPANLREIITALTAGGIPDYQMAAFLMAVYFRGLSAGETSALTLAMRDSGEVLEWPADPRPLVDKHSTGGVGDKVSLPLAPLLACLGFRVPMISGRGLGITGGTLDKLEAIPGFNTALPPDQIVAQVQDIGCVICGQTATMVPADKTIYALRDVTATVPSIPLITASILSKKLAEGLEALILDVKFGCAAFMQEQDAARELATAMVRLGNDCGTPTRAVLTGMSRPLGQACGNWLEIVETVACLQGEGPGDLRALVLECAANLMVQTQRSAALDEARATAAACLGSGEPLAKWEAMLAAQGADMDAYRAKLAQATTAPVVLEVKAPNAGYIAECNARIVGEAVRDLGAGRITKDTVIDIDVGIDALAQCGDKVEAGALLARIHAREAGEAHAAEQRLLGAFIIAAEPPAAEPLVYEVIT